MKTTRMGAMAVVALLAGCASSFGRMDGVLVDVQPEARPAEASEYDRVEITREGRQENGRPGGAVKKGDAILTAADGIGVMTLVDGYQVIMDPGTDLTIENPSIFLRVGRIIVKKIKEIKEALTVKTELGAAVVQGTEFVFEVNRRQEAEIRVLEGRVTVMPRGPARWRDTITYVAGEGGRLDSARIQRMAPLTPRVVDSLRRRIQRVEGTIRPQVPDVIRLSEAEARDELERYGLVAVVVPVVTRQGRIGPPPGTVVATRPAAGSQTKMGARIRIEVEERSVPVPNVMGQSLADAIRFLARSELRLGDTTSVLVTDGVAGTVNGMSPTPGTYVRPGTAVALTVMRIQQAPQTCRVPDLRRMTEPQAAQALANANLVKGQVYTNSGRLITDQSPAPGTQVTCRSAVSITIGTRIGE